MSQIGNFEDHGHEHRHDGFPHKNKTEYEAEMHEKRLLERLKGMYDTCLTYYAPIQRKMKLLDATDTGDLWKALKTKFPPYQILPDTNFIAYVKSNLVASVYSVGKSASIQPTSEHDKNIVVPLNIAMERIWDMADVRYFEYRAGERAALLNMGVTQVSWDDSKTRKMGSDIQKGDIALKNIDPLKFMRDPFATSLETAGYCMTYENYHKSVFEENALYKDKFREYRQKHLEAYPLPIPNNDNKQQPVSGDMKDYYTLVTFWVREHGVINEYHTIGGEFLLCTKEEIKPNSFPFAVLYCNEPAGKLVGVSECLKSLASNISYNLMDSIALTAEYKNQRPPKFVSTQSGLNVASFSKHGDEADKTFIVNGDATRAVHYHQFPNTSNQLTTLKMGLEQGIELMTGVTQKYTGQSTGSILTTGGMEQMLNRVTIIDVPKITQYERYAKQLTSLILYNFLHFSSSRDYFYQKPNTTEWKTITVDYPNIDADTAFNYSLDISSELPKSKETLAQIADNLMEKQMQYQQQGNSVQLITEEEWLMYQNLPNKEYMLERMGIQRQQDAITEVSQTVFQYANLVKNGMTPDDALMATAQTMQKQRQGENPITPEPGVQLATQSQGV